MACPIISDLANLPVKIPSLYLYTQAWIFKALLSEKNTQLKMRGDLIPIFLRYLHEIYCFVFLQVIVAGSIDDFQLFVWSVKTARLLDILSAHEGPISQLAFSPTHSLLASASWDKTVRTWDIFR